MADDAIPRPPHEDPPMEPMSGSTWWISSDAQALIDDPATATLVIRLQLALNSLTVHMANGVKTSEAEPAESSVRVRDLFYSMLTTGAYAAEALKILTGSTDAPAEADNVKRLAIKGGADSEIIEEVERLCKGKHDRAAALVAKLRNKFGFHWDPKPIRASLMEFVVNRTLVWAEASGPTTDDVVHRLAIDVMGNAIFAKVDFAETDDLEARKAKTQQVLMTALEDVAGAALTIIRYFNFAVMGYLDQIGAKGHRRSAPSQSGSD